MTTHFDGGRQATAYLRAYRLSRSLLSREKPASRAPTVLLDLTERFVASNRPAVTLDANISGSKQPEQRPSVMLVMSTCPRNRAHALAQELIGERVAACVNVVGDVTSTYRWEGSVQTDEEALLVIKTTAAGYDALERALVAIHPYDVPEIIAVPVGRGLPSYLRWVGESVGQTSE